MLIKIPKVIEGSLSISESNDSTWVYFGPFRDDTSSSPQFVSDYKQTIFYRPSYLRFLEYMKGENT